MRYFSRHLYLCLQSTHLSITIELNNVDSSGLVLFWACILLGLFDRGADLSQSGDGCRLSQPGWCMQASTAYLPLPLTLGPIRPRKRAPGCRLPRQWEGSSRWLRTSVALPPRGGFRLMV